MSTIAFKGEPVYTSGKLPEKGTKAPAFRLTRSDLSDIHLSDLKGKKAVLNIFPSIDTGVCAASVRKFNEMATGMENTLVLCISKDLPFAHKRFCGAEGITNVISASQYKDHSFSENYQVDMNNGPLAGLMSRAIVVIDTNGDVIYTEQVPDITQEPDYEAVLAALDQ